MQKTILLLTSIFTLSGLHSQTFTAANEPSIGATKTMYVCDSFATNYANLTGNGVVWDYSALTSYVGQTKVMDVLAPSATAYNMDYPSATAAVRLESFNYNFIESSASNRSSEGFVLEGTTFGDVKAIFSSNAQLLMNYPFSLGNSVVDSFAGNLSFVYSGIPQNPACSGISHSTFDGVGSFIDPSGTTVANIARIHILDTMWTNIPIIGATQIIRSQYEYYNLSSTDYLPIFLHSSVKIISAFPEPLYNMSVVMSETAGLQTASLEETTSADVFVYPNPATHSITITELSIDAEVYLIDLVGRKTRLVSTSDQFVLPEWSKGTYLLEIIQGERRETLPFVVE